MPTRDAVELQDALESIENRTQAAREFAGNVLLENERLREDVEALNAGVTSLNRDLDHAKQAAYSLTEQKHDLALQHERDVENLNRAAAELRGIVGMQSVKLDAKDRTIKHLENKLELAQEQRDGDQQALRIGRLVVGMLKTSPLGGRDLIQALQDAVDHLDGDDLEPIQSFNVPPASTAVD
jgi:septation ring formation regulator EzrA